MASEKPYPYAPPAAETYASSYSGSPEEQAHARIQAQNKAQSNFNSQHGRGRRRRQRGGFPLYSSPDDPKSDQIPVPQFHTGVAPAGPQNANSASQIGGNNLAIGGSQASMDNTVPYTPTKGTAAISAPAAGGRRRKTRRRRKKTRRKKTRRKKTRRKKTRRKKTRRHKKRHRRHKTRRKKRTKRKKRKKRKTRKYRGGATDADIEWVFNKINTRGTGEIDFDDIVDAIENYRPGISPRDLPTMVLSTAHPSTPRCFDPLTLNKFKQINNGFHPISDDNRITDSGVRVPGDNNWNLLFRTILDTRGGGGGGAAAAAGGGGGQET